MDNLFSLWASSGLGKMTPGQGLMILIGLLLLFLAIRKQFEPLLLVPIGFGGILANIPGAGLAYNALNKSALSNSLKSLYEIALDGSNTSELKSTLESSVNDLDFGPVCQ